MKNFLGIVALLLVCAGVFWVIVKLPAVAVPAIQSQALEAVLEPITGNSEAVGAATNTPVAPTPTVVVSVVRTAPSVIKAISRIGRLETLSVEISKPVEVERTKDLILGIKDSERLRIDAKATVIAGIDFDAITVNDIQTSLDGKKVVIDIPQAFIFSVIPDEASFMPVSRSVSMFGKKTDALLAEARKIAIQAIKDRAIESNVCGMATENAKKSIENLLSKMGFIEIVVNASEQNGACG